MKFLAPLICAIWLVFSNTAFGLTCTFPMPTLEERFKSADFIFVGVPTEDVDTTDKTPEFSRKVKVKVTIILKGKGKSGSMVDVFYRKPKDSFDVCNPDTGNSMRGAAKNKSEILFYAKKLNNRNYTSQAMGGGNIKFSDVGEELKKLKSIKP
ncbi:MAG: hypothetical protein AB7K68_00180 [Bacteriovoracia bacterium]